MDVNEINKFELNLKKVTSLWNYLTVSVKITNGKLYKLEFINFENDTHQSRVEFKLIEHKILINNKVLYDIVDKNTICIYNKYYKLNETYELPLYVINESKNLNFPKIVIKFI